MILSWTVPAELSVAEIEDMIADWAKGCARLQSAGFAGVEISAGHGHLFHQFLSPWSNRRLDEYGGDLEGRGTVPERAGLCDSCGVWLPLYHRS